MLVHDCRSEIAGHLPTMDCRSGSEEDGCTGNHVLRMPSQKGDALGLAERTKASSYANRSASLGEPETPRERRERLLLASYIARIQTPSDGRVRRAFNDGAAVGEERHLVRIMPELQDEVVMADDAVRLQAAVHLEEVDGTAALMNLHGIPAAQGDVRAALAGKMDEIALNAGTTAGTRLHG